MLAAAWLTAGATTGLFIGAIITAIYAIRAFRAQSREVTAIEQQVTDQQQVTGQQARLLEVQSGQLDLQRQQLDEQRGINEAQTEVLRLQAEELRESLAERKRDAEAQRQSQAARVTAWLDRARGDDPALVAMIGWGARVRNASDLPVFDVRVFFQYVTEKWDHGDWEPRMLGGSVEKLRVLPPQEDRFVEIPTLIKGTAGGLDDSNCVVSIEFTDAYGSKWERDPRGALLPPLVSALAGLIPAECFDAPLHRLVLPGGRGPGQIALALDELPERVRPVGVAVGALADPQDDVVRGAGDAQLLPGLGQFRLVRHEGHTVDGKAVRRPAVENPLPVEPDSLGLLVGQCFLGALLGSPVLQPSRPADDGRHGEHDGRQATHG